MANDYPNLDPLELEKWRNVPPAERLRIGSELFSAHKAELLTNIRQELGRDDPKEMRRRLFLKLYGSDFTPEESDRILRHLDQTAPV